MATARRDDSRNRVPTEANSGRDRRLGIPLLDDVVDEAIGHGHRRDPVATRSGGPAGNARLTSWVGLLLLALIAGELLTLLNVTGLMSWHAGLGIALVGVALLKTASTGWRILRYYAGSPQYRKAGPPPALLRLLGPFVVAATLGVLGSGIVLVAEGPEQSRTSRFSVLGHGVRLLTVHQGFFILFAVFAGLHLLARFVPALTVVAGWPRRPRHQEQDVPGKPVRAATIVITAVVSAVAALLVVPAASGWHRDHRFDRAPHYGGSSAVLSHARTSSLRRSAGLPTSRQAIRRLR